MKIAFVTLGCKVNLCETQGLMQLALERGDEIVERDADAVIVNSCAVTAISERKNMRAIHKARKENPVAIIAVMGCMAQTNPDKLLADGTADLICGVQNRISVLEACEAALTKRNEEKMIPACRAIRQEFEVLSAGVPRGRTRALLKIEDGCNNFCSYCIIPYARGRVRSLPVEKALEEAVRLAAAGIQEIVLTGIEIASYGQDLSPRISLVELVETLCRKCSGVRFRLGSLEPRLITEEFCKTLSHLLNLAPHFHLSLQSGCDGVLKRMNRKYTCAVFEEAVKRLRQAFPDCSITADVIVGFPGETEEEFETTCNFLEKIGFSDVHVFPYSIRPGTKAAQLSNQIEEAVKKQRADRVRELAEQLSLRYRTRFIGKTLTILPEHLVEKQVWAAHSAYAFPVYVKDTALQKNVPAAVVLTGIERDGIAAQRISKDCEE